MRAGGPLDELIAALAGLPGLGPRSARRVALHLLTDKNGRMMRLIGALQNAADNVRVCITCGNLDLSDPCRLCSDEKRANGVLCVVSGVAGVWAIERTGAFKGRYHVLGGVLSALDSIGPDDLRIDDLIARIEKENTREIILALSATVDGQATAHYISDRMRGFGELKITRLAQGVPVGGDLDYLDEGTITTALRSRAAV